MGTQSEVKDHEGNTTHIRETSDDGRRSELYTVDNSLVAHLLGDHRGERVEVADHLEDGTTRAYEADNSILGNLLGSDGKGEEKSDSDSCCYIVSACLDDLGLKRDSLEMKAMKELTKEHILKSFTGKRDYVTYGRIGPRIVDAIRAKQEPKAIWDRVYGVLKQVAKIVDQGNYQEAHKQYKSLVLNLQQQVL